MNKFKEQKSTCISLEDFDEIEQNQFQKRFKFANDYSITKMLKE